jgi:hypothetical protein
MCSEDMTKSPSQREAFFALFYDLLLTAAEMRLKAIVFAADLYYIIETGGAFGQRLLKRH